MGPGRGLPPRGEAERGPARELSQAPGPPLRLRRVCPDGRRGCPSSTRTARSAVPTVASSRAREGRPASSGPGAPPVRPAACRAPSIQEQRASARGVGRPRRTVRPAVQAYRHPSQSARASPSALARRTARAACFSSDSFQPSSSSGVIRSGSTSANSQVSSPLAGPGSRSILGRAGPLPDEAPIESWHASHADPVDEGPPVRWRAWSTRT